MRNRYASLLVLAAVAARAAAQPAATGPATQPADYILPPLSTQPADGGGLSTRPSVVVRAFRFVGNAHVPEAELRAVVANNVGRPLGMEDLEAARVALTQHLVNKGFINSGAVLPDQDVADGVVTFQVVEGKLTDVRVTGTVRLRPDYVADRLRRAAAPPLDILRLQDQLELLRQDVNVRSLNAELRPGLSPGEAAIDVRVAETNPLQLGLRYSNRRPPSVGSTALDALLTHTDLTGRGDRLDVRYDVANGRPLEPDLAGAEDFSVSYAIPISPADTTLGFDFTRTDSVVVETPFEDLDIHSRAYSYALTLRQPVYRRPTFEPATATTPARPAVEFAVFASLSYREDATTLLGEPFVFSPATPEPKTRVWAIRVGQELTTRTQTDALSLRSTFSFGLPVFNATTAPRELPDPGGGDPIRAADGQFISWLGQAQYVRRLGPAFRLGRLDLSDAQLALRGAVQFSNSPLLTTEQFAVGGTDTVRGYRENTLVRDQGATASAELRIPVLRAGGGESVLTVVPFADVGYASDLSGVSGSTNLSSVGVGLVFAPDPRFNAQLFYGYALQNRSDSRRDLQDVGLHFSVTVLAF